MSILRRIAAARFLPLETNANCLDFAQRPAGKIILLAAFGLLLMPGNRLWLPVLLAVAASSFAGRHRSAVVSIGTLLVLACYPGWFDMSAIVVLVARANSKQVHIPSIEFLRLSAIFLTLAFSAAAVCLARRFKGHRFIRRPIVCLHGAFAAFLMLAVSGVLGGTTEAVLWGFISALSAYFWFLCYAVMDQKSKDGKPFSAQLGAFHPFWGSTTTPIGKGEAYLRKIEASSRFELAVTQLKGLKLLLWSFILRALSVVLSLVVLKHLRIPEFRDAFAKQMAGVPYPWYLCWASLIYAFFDSMLSLAIWGHIVVACGRMAGYRMLRNTCRPLQSRTLAEFWNRYYYYFKELLVEVFFYPTFLRYLKRYPRLRLPFATFVAACIGNLIFHFVRDIGYVAQMGLWKAIVGYQTYAFYCSVLGIGIAVSQFRQRTRSPHQSLIRRRMVPALCVATFFCVLNVFNDTQRVYSLNDHFTFFFHLFGVDVWM